MDDVDLAVVACAFQAVPGREAEVAAALARYVVLSRGHAGCRNIDLVASLSEPGHFLVYEKWESFDDQGAHMGSVEMSELASAVTPLLAGPAELGLYQAVSAHDLT
jgi:quinol monooxygenase YgiN